MTPGTPAEQLAANRANWDERVEPHLVAYDADGFVADPARISSVVRDDLALMAPHLPGGSVTGLDLMHLQCHIGTDTLSWARLGARVTGVDFSPAAVAAARDLAACADLAATFVQSDVLTTAEALAGRTFDVVHTSIGVLCWLPDLSAWAATIAALLRPGGLFFVRDAHPVLNAMDAEDPATAAGQLALTRPYFATGAPLRYESGADYADERIRLVADVTYEWQHSLSEIVQSLLDAGLRLTSLAEHTTIPWRALPTMVPTADGTAWQLPEHPERLPLTFSLTATKP